MRMTVETVGIRLFVCLSVGLSLCVRLGLGFNAPPVWPIGALVYGKPGDDPIGSRPLFFAVDLKKKQCSDTTI